MNVKRAIKEEGNVVFTLNWGFSYVGNSRRLEVVCNAGFEGWLWTSGRLERAELWDTPDHPPTCPFCFIQMEEQPCAGTAPCGLLRIPLYISALVGTQHHNSTQKARNSLGTLIFSSLFISGPETSKPCKKAAVLQKRMCKDPKHRMHKDHTDEGVVRHEHRWNPKGPTSRHAKRWVQTRVLLGLG